MKILCLFILAISALGLASEEEALRRIYAHLNISDHRAALKEAKQYAQQFPESKPLKIALLRAICESGEEMDSLQQWKEITQTYPELSQDRECLEILAWSVLKQGMHASQPAISLNALVGSSMTHDARAVSMLQSALRSSSAILRSLGANLASLYGDIPLREELVRLLKEEKIWYVRIEVIKAIGKLHMLEQKPMLMQILSRPKTLAEEKVQVLLALVNMYDQIDDQELLNLIQSPRAGLRQLAAEIAIHLDLTQQVHYLSPLLKDSHPDVRQSVLNALALLKIATFDEKPIQEIARIMIEDSSFEVAVTAAYLGLINHEESVKEKLSKWILQGREEERRVASAALSSSGAHGIELALELIAQTKDPYVRVNLAVGLIGQRKEINRAAEILYLVLQSEKEQLLMWDSSVNPLFRSLAPSEVRHMQQIPNYPQVVDQLTRLDILSALAIVEHKQALVAVKEFLKSRTPGLAGSAAIALLQEGDLEAFELIRTLLNDEDEKIRVQAALVLAIFGADRTALKVLEQAYPKVNREIKLYIVQALARIGDPKTIPFLLEILQEPFQIMRVTAASAIIQCLYH